MNFTLARLIKNTQAIFKTKKLISRLVSSRALCLNSDKKITCLEPSPNVIAYAFRHLMCVLFITLCRGQDTLCRSINHKRPWTSTAVGWRVNESNDSAQLHHILHSCQIYVIQNLGKFQKEKMEKRKGNNNGIKNHFQYLISSHVINAMSFKFRIRQLSINIQDTNLFTYMIHIIN